MQKLKSTLTCLLIGLALSFGCSKKADNPNAMIAGTSNKTWHPEKETNAAGDKEKLSDDEKNEAWVFYSNGTMAMNLTSQSVKGNWIYDASGKTLTITPENMGSQQFIVEDLSDDKMKLKAEDGSEMKLEAED
jgi:antitoxin component YwqK of YwqJK toxin-antitoxin module